MFGGPLKNKEEGEKCNYLMLWFIPLGIYRMMRRKYSNLTIPTSINTVKQNQIKFILDTFLDPEFKRKVNHLRIT